MGHKIYLFSLFVLFFTLSCTGQNKELKEQLPNHPKGMTIGRSSDVSHDYMPGEILVKFREGRDEQTIEVIQRELHLKTIRIVSKPNLYLMKILNGSSVDSVMDCLKDFQAVEYSEPNYIRRGF